MLKTAADYRKLAAKYRADGQKGTRAGMVYASMMAGRCERAAKMLESGATVEQAWRHLQG